jgi:hypothetical protein
MSLAFAISLNIEGQLNVAAGVARAIEVSVSDLTVFEPSAAARNAPRGLDMDGPLAYRPGHAAQRWMHPRRCLP